MKQVVLLDTGPLVAFLNHREDQHAWAKREFGLLIPPLLTCESVLAEACWLVRGLPDGTKAVMDLLERNVVRIAFSLGAEIASVRSLMDRYRNLPMSLADACLVRMAEMREGAEVLTLDSHFRVYRMSSRRMVPVRMPRE